MGNGLGWILLAAGVATQVVALLLLRRSVRRLNLGGTTHGVIVDNGEAMHAATGGGRSQRFFFPIVEFTTIQGEAFRFTSDTGRGVSSPVGSRVRVLYDPDRPQDASLATFAALWLFPLVTSLFGLPFLAAGLAALL